MKIINPPLKKYALLVLNERTQRECHTPHGSRGVRLPPWEKH